MNPDNTIRKWLLACGNQHGIRQAHDYHWPDPETRQDEAYFEYRIVSSVPIQDGVQDESTATGNDVTHLTIQKWLTTVQIELFNSQDGIRELASFCVAAQGNQVIGAIFDGYHSPPRSPTVTDHSIKSDEEIKYKHRLVCEFEEDIDFELSETNGKVDFIDFQLDDGTDYPRHLISDDGVFIRLEIDAEAGDLVASGSMTFVEA